MADSLNTTGAPDETGMAFASDSLRKDDHLRLALQQEDLPHNAFDDIHIMHHALAACDVSEVDISTLVCGQSWKRPFYINAMTGGSMGTGDVNGMLAKVAGTTHLAMASGSQHAALKDATLAKTFTTIRRHTDGFVFANVSPSVTPAEAQRAIDMLHADALQIHLNAAQEIVMLEGGRHFDFWPVRIAEIADAVSVPVVVKEVGFGLSARTIRQLAQLGIQTVDVSGTGGTDFAQIEHERRTDGEYDYMSQWGQSTVLSLLTALHGYCGGQADDAAAPAVLASGGVRNPLDVFKALALGARAVGVSGHFLRTLHTSGEQGLIDEISSWTAQLTGLMALVGAHNLEGLNRVGVLVTGITAQQATLLGVDLTALAQRDPSSCCA